MVQRKIESAAPSDQIACAMINRPDLCKRLPEWFDSLPPKIVAQYLMTTFSEFRSSKLIVKKIAQTPVLLEACACEILERSQNEKSGCYLPKMIENALMGSKKRILDWGNRYPILFRNSTVWESKIDLNDVEFWKKCTNAYTISKMPLMLWNHHDVAKIIIGLVEKDELSLSLSIIPKEVKLFFQTFQTQGYEYMRSIVEKNYLTVEEQPPSADSAPSVTDTPLRGKIKSRL